MWELYLVLASSSTTNRQPLHARVGCKLQNKHGSALLFPRASAQRRMKLQKSAYIAQKSNRNGRHAVRWEKRFIFPCMKTRTQSLELPCESHFSIAWIYLSVMFMSFLFLVITHSKISTFNVKNYKENASFNNNNKIIFLWSKKSSIWILKIIFLQKNKKNVAYIK